MIFKYSILDHTGAIETSSRYNYKNQQFILHSKWSMLFTAPWSYLFYTYNMLYLPIYVQV